MSGQNRPDLRRSRRLATIVPASDWIGMGYDAEAAAALEFLQLDIQALCEGGEGDDARVINLRGRVSDDADESISTYSRFLGGPTPHSDLMIPHWERLAKTLALGDVENFVVASINLPRPVLDTILPALSMSHNLSNLELMHTDMGSAGVLRLSSFLRNNTSLTSVRIGGEALTDLDVVESFSNAVKDHVSLIHLMLLGCGLDDTRVLRRIISGCQGLEHICFYSEGLGAEGAAVIAEAFRGNRCLTHLHMLRNNFSDDDAMLLATGLRQNDCFRSLNLSENNNITDAGRKSLMDTIYDTSSIESIAQSNHSCEIECTDEGDQTDVEKCVLFINRMRGRVTQANKIRMKVVLALCGDDRVDTTHFDGVPSALYPELLDLIQARSDTMGRIVPELIAPTLDSRMTNFALSRVFQVVKEMPSMFESMRASAQSARKRKRHSERWAPNAIR